MKGKGEFTEQLEAVIDIERAFAAKLGAFYVDKDSGLSSISEEALKKMAEKGGASAKIATAIQRRQEKDRNPQSNKTKPDEIEHRSGYKNENEAGPQRKNFVNRLKQKYDEFKQKVTNLLGGKRGGEVGGLTGDQNSVQQERTVGLKISPKRVAELRKSSSKPTTTLKEEQRVIEKPRLNNNQNNSQRPKGGYGR